MSGRLKALLARIPVRAWLYAGAAAIAFLAVMLPVWLTGTEGVGYSICWGLLAGLGALVVTRTVYHCASGDNSAEMWAVSIYGIVADIGWLIGILSTTYVGAIVGVVIMLAAAMMALGSRYLGRDGWRRKAMDLRAELNASLRYRLMGDVVGGAIDINRRLVQIEGEADPLTVDEAYALGYEAEAKEAEGYVKSVILRYLGKEEGK